MSLCCNSPGKSLKSIGLQPCPMVSILTFSPSLPAVLLTVWWGEPPCSRSLPAAGAKTGGCHHCKPKAHGGAMGAQPDHLAKPPTPWVLRVLALHPPPNRRVVHRGLVLVVPTSNMSILVLRKISAFSSLSNTNLNSRTGSCQPGSVLGINMGFLYNPW